MTAKRGYTLVEMVIVMLIFSVVMLLISTSFGRIVSGSSQIFKAVETDIGGLIGLEVLRGDLESAGLGLPWSVNGVKYREAEGSSLVKGCPGGCPGAAPARFNDAAEQSDQVGNPPRPYQVGDNVGLNGSDYLVLKGTALGMTGSARRWSYLNYSSTGVVVKASKSELELSPGQGDRVIVLRTGMRQGEPTRELVTDGSAFSFLFDGNLPQAAQPGEKKDTFLVYGVTHTDESGSPTLSFPFNRADYFISRTSAISPNCAPGTGILYKLVWNHSGAAPTYYPLLDCAADLQVLFSLDTNGDGETDFHSAGVSETNFTADELRRQLQEVRVYILAQQGRKDPLYHYPVADPSRVITVGDAELDRGVGQVLGSVWSQADLETRFGSEWRNYHWKLYTIVVQPKNL